MMQESMPALTVLMSCYNNEPWLAEAIESVLAQTFRDFEFIIINDGSRDRTLEIIQQFAALDERIVVIDKANTGTSDSLNRGIQQARGVWIARIDADDLCESHRLERQIAFAASHPEVVLLGAGFQEIDPSGSFVKAHRYPADHACLLRHLERSRAFFPHSSAFYRTSVVRHIGGYRRRITHAEDTDLWLRLSAQGKLACISEPLVKIRKHATQMSNDDGGRQQISDDCVAVICHFLRQRGIADPVDTPDEEYVNGFFAWVKQEMNKAGVFEMRRAWAEARVAYFVQSNRLVGLACFAVQLMTSGHAFRLIKEKLVGTDLAERLALKWEDNGEIF